MRFITRFYYKEVTMSKGSKARPIQVSASIYADNWERTFGTNPSKCGISKEGGTCSNHSCPQLKEYNPAGCSLENTLVR
jgi:hypothetical protein